MASHKIFVDLDEEIVFTVEKILDAPTQRVILVIPESASLVTSFVSLKLLSRQINRSDKLTAIVTEDKLGLQLAQKAGLVAKEKISDITPGVWVEAEKLKNAFLESRKELKNALIGARTETNEYTIIDEKGVGKEKPQDEEVPEEAVEEEGVFAPAAPDKPRLEPKVIDLGNVAVLGGGDIEQNLDMVPALTHAVTEEEPDDKDSDEPPEPESVKEVEPEEMDEEASDEEQKEQEIIAVQKKRRQAMIGRDMSALVPSSSKPSRVPRAHASGGGPAIGVYFTNLKNKIVEFYSTGDRRIKIGVTVAVVLLFLFLMSNTVFASSSVTVYVSKEEVSVAEKVTGKTNATGVDTTTLTLPVKEIKVNETSSNSGNATGAPNSGEKAKGLVNIYNKQEDKEVTLPAGTVITSTSTSLKYKLLTPATIEKAVRVGVDLDIGVKEDVQVEAESFGEKYNTSGTKGYTVQGYSSGDVEARSINDITGGTTSDKTSVAQTDIDELKNGLVDELKNTLIRELEQLVSEDEQLIEGTIKYADPKVTSDKKVGDEADTLNVNVDLEATALVAAKNDLKTLVAELIKRSSEFEGEVDIEKLQDPTISNVEMANGTVTFNLSADGNITAGLTKEQLAKDLAGKSPGEAKSHLDGIDGVEDYEVSVGPFFLPGFLKKMPSEDKINVRIIEAK